MVCSQAAQASYSGRMAPPGRPKTSVTPSASSDRITASAPVILRFALSTGDRLTIGVSGELPRAVRVVGERAAHGLAHLPGRVGAAAGHLVDGGRALGQHLVDGCGDGPADVAAAEAVREHHAD